MNGKVMVLIDADNVSADVVAQALAHVIEVHGAAHVRRAYCTAESALKNLALFKRLSIRPIVNVSTGKNSTDIALAVDAVDLVLAERPAIVVIVSSDSDFAPLVIRLREKGCRVEGIGQAGKTGDDSVGVYDGFVDLEHRKGRAKRAEQRSEPKSQPKSEPKPKAPKAPRASAKAAPVLAASAPPAPPPAPLLPDDVQSILNAVPVLQSGARLELGIAAERLRAAGLLSNRAPSTKLFKKHSDFFELTPERQPNKVQFLASSASPR